MFPSKVKCLAATDFESPHNFLACVKMKSISTWLAESELNPDLEQLLQQFKILEFKDLDDFFMNEVLLQRCKSGMSKVDFTKFAAAYLATMVDGAEDDDNESITEKSDSWVIPSVTISTSSCGLKRTLEALKTSGKCEAKKDNKLRKIAAIDKKLLESASLDVLVMLDCTTSMSPFIDAAKARIQAFVKAIGETFPGIPLRIGFLGYRDICNGTNRLVVLPFQEDLSVFQSQLARVSAFGGGRPLTDLSGALKVAAKLDWSSSIRALFHIGDYPCHGVKYHDGLRDMYPEGDPHGLCPEVFVQLLAEKKVNYCFGQLTPNTDKMIAAFNKHVGWEYIKSSPMSNVTMMEVVTSYVTTLLTTSLSATSSTSGNGSVHSRECNVVPAMPADWSKVHTERALAFTLTRVTSIDSLCTNNETVSIVNDFPASGALYIKCAQDPFSRGGSKMAYFAQVVTGLSDNAVSASATPIRVLKQSVYASKAFQKLKTFSEFLAPQRAALYFASLYNKARPAGTPTVEFMTTRLVQFLARPDKPYYIEETHLSGHWERYNNNTGFCARCPTPRGTDHRTVQAFSHWTHHVSGGRLMITDCQGCFDTARNAFVLTDPAVHCSSSLLGYGGTNLGDTGFDRFFKTHRCNDTCSALNLPEVVLEEEK